MDTGVHLPAVRRGKSDCFCICRRHCQGVPPMKHNQIRQVVFPILAALIWGTAFVAQDVCADTIGTFTFNAVRYFIAVLALLVLIAVRMPCIRTARSRQRRKNAPGANSSGSAAFAAARRWPSPRTSSRPASPPGRTPERRAFSRRCTWCSCRCSACFSGARSVCRYGSRSRCRSYPCTCCASRAASASPRATCSCSCARCALPCTFWSSTTSVQRAMG